MARVNVGCMSADGYKKCAGEAVHAFSLRLDCALCLFVAVCTLLQRRPLGFMP